MFSINRSVISKEIPDLKEDLEMFYKYILKDFENFSLALLDFTSLNRKGGESCL